MIVKFALVLLGSTLVATGSPRAQVTQQTDSGCSNYTTVAQMRGALSGSDADVKDEAIACGYKSQNKSVRGLVIHQLIAGLKSLTFTLENAQGSASSLADLASMPNFYARSVYWGQDGRTFSGNGMGEVTGQLLNEGLTINFSGLWLPKDPRNTTGDGVHYSCSALLTINPDKERIEGPLRCSGMKSTFILVLGS